MVAFGWIVFRAAGSVRIISLPIVAAALPNLYDTVVSWLHPLSDTLGVDLGEVWTFETIQEWVRNPDNQQTLQELLGGFGSGAGRILRGVAETFTVVVLAPVLGGPRCLCLA